MKLLLSLMVAGATVLFAGGDILPVQDYKPMVHVYQKQHVVQKQRGCYKPNIQKCPNCVEVAEICPDDPNAPIIESIPCEADINH
ncbi:MAG: hypothetical protein DSZ07_07135 [Sulfurovum sp.]|nr:MAG: hypothetical protein DSZ07_07135 [Sulfurovum sp.]